MKYKTYYQLKRMARQDIWEIGIKDGSIDEHAQRVAKRHGIGYFNKSTILEMLSVNHREWVK